MVQCKLCAVRKAKQKNVPKESKHVKADKPGAIIFINIAMIKGEKNRPRVNPKQHWRIMVDECTFLNFPDLFEMKSGIVEPTLEQFNRWAQRNMKV
eukprot:14017276-Ditylum_brightwellii.AAC.2